MPALGPEAARRWLVWRDFVHSGRPLVLVIGGTTGCGKSTIATALAHRLEIVRMQSTDLLREVMRNMLSSDQYPELHSSSYDAWRSMAEGDDDLVLAADGQLEKGFQAQAKLVSTASKAVIKRALIEGVHAHPRLAADIVDDDAVILHIMLAILKKRKLKQRISGRATKAVQRRAQEYLEHFDDIWRLQTYLLDEADQTNTAIIINGDREEAVQEIMRTLLDQLSENNTPSPDTVFAE
jgi:2-phosphoglycerate kinase